MPDGTVGHIIYTHSVSDVAGNLREGMHNGSFNSIKCTECSGLTVAFVAFDDH